MSFNKVKADPELGRQVQLYLESVGVATPTIKSKFSNRSEKIDYIESKFKDIMTALSLDLNDDSLAETPNRVAKMLVQETMWGLDYETFPKCTTVENKMNYDEMIVEKDISIKSSCEHHFVPIVGFAHVAYIPNKKVLGLSKIPRICEHFSRRPQIQERLTEQIYYALSFILDTPNVAVTINAKHLCVSHRGIEDTNANTTTSKLGGVFKKDSSVRTEYLKHIYKD